MLELEKKILKEKLGNIVSFSESMKDHSSLKIGGKTFAFVSPKTEKELKTCVKILKELKIPFRVIGAGTNILFSSNLNGIAIISTINMLGSNICLKSQTLTACAGEKLSTLFNITQKAGLSGFENLATIPGTVGGAIINNAGAFGTEVKDILYSVKIITPCGKIKTIKAEEVGLTYRNSKLKNSGYIIISAVFKLKLLAPSVIKHIALENIRIRKETQPTGLSAGSVFKKVNYVSAGKLIEDAGLKGFKIGGCMISEKHANFILNIGGAKTSDFKRLVLYAQKEIKKKFNVTLEREIEYI